MRRRPIPGRLFLWVVLLALAVGVWRAHSTGFATWSNAQRYGGVWTVLPLKSLTLVASLWGNRIYRCETDRVTWSAYPRPLQLVPDGQGGAYVLGLLSNSVGRLDAYGNPRPATVFPPSQVIAAVLAEEGGAWVAAYDLRRADGREKNAFYMPEYSVFRWYLQWFSGGLPGGAARFSADSFTYDNDVWHEETAGAWRLLATRDRLFLVKDQAETVNCLDKTGGRLIWQASTGARPTGAVVWGDRLLVCSAQTGAIEAYRLDNGGRIWPAPRAIGRGLSDMRLLADKVALTDMVHDRLLLVDPMFGQVVKEITLGGAPRALATIDDGVLVGLDSAAQLVKLDWAWSERKRWSLWPEASP